MDPRLGSFAFRYYNIIANLQWCFMRFGKGGKTFKFSQVEKCNESQQWTSAGPSNQHIHESIATDKLSQRDQIPHVLGGAKPWQGS